MHIPCCLSEETYPPSAWGCMWQFQLLGWCTHTMCLSLASCTLLMAHTPFFPFQFVLANLGHSFRAQSLLAVLHNFLFISVFLFLTASWQVLHIGLSIIWLQFSRFMPLKTTQHRSLSYLWTNGLFLFISKCLFCLDYYMYLRYVKSVPFKAIYNLYSLL